MLLGQPFIVLAPMSGITDFPFRQIVRKYGAPSLVVSEMIASASMVREIKKSLQRNCQGEEETAVQLAGNDPLIMAEAARMSVDRGARLIDINMGCPAKKIAINSYAGAALMKEELLASQIIEAVVKAVPVPVTVKMRKGWDTAHQNALNLARIAKESGVAWVTVHGRTRCQLFTGKADWDFIHQMAKSLDLPLIGNGDVRTEEDATHLIQGIAGIMVGRGCYGRPWLIKQLRHFLTTGEHLPPPSLEMQHEIVQEHFDHMLSYYGQAQAIPLARKHLGWYSKGLPGAGEFRTSVFQENDPLKIKQAIDRLFKEAAVS